ncbi:hypothetical protein ABFS82_10G162800 [Erythranthe guttata]
MEFVVIGLGALGLGLLLDSLTGGDSTKPRNPFPRIKEQNSVADNDDDEGLMVETRDASPAHFATKLNSFSLLSKYGIHKYESRKFVAGDYNWRLIIYPDGKENGDRDHISVYLAMTETSSLPQDWEFNVTFTIFLYNQILDKYACFRVNERCFNGTTSKWGFSKLISKKALTDQSSGYLVEDNIVLGAEVLVIKRHRVIETVNLLKPTEVPQTRDWKIQEFSILEEDGVWISEEFTLANFNWKLKLYPNRDSDSKGRELLMELVCVSANSFDDYQKIKAEFCIRLNGRPGFVQSSRKLSHWFTSSDKSCVERASVNFATIRNWKGLLIDDCCSLQLEILVQLIV